VSNAPLASGLDASYWRNHVESLPAWDPPPGGRVIVLAPHPDDEVLACGGLLQRYAHCGATLEIWMVTAGEACFGDAVPHEDVAVMRKAEALAAHERISMTANNCRVRWLGIPDGRVQDNVEPLRRLLTSTATPDTTLVAPMLNDVHPDHEATGEAAFLAAEATGAQLVSYPVWLWHSGRKSDLHQIPGPVVRLRLTASEQCRKHDAIAAFTSQIEPVTNDQAILPRGVLRHFYNAHEVFHLHQSGGDAYQR
jgi:LmbE family N-acetylglucosaminyl deacetylase